MVGLAPAAVAIALPVVVMWQQRTAVLSAAAPAEFPFVDNPIVGAGFPRGPLTAVAVMGRYLWLFVWPARLSADYWYAQIPLASGRAGDWMAWIAVALFAAISRLVEDAAKGEDIVIAKAGRPIVRLVPVSVRQKRRRSGTMKGKIRIRKNFDAPLPDDLARAFGIK